MERAVSEFAEIELAHGFVAHASSLAPARQMKLVHAVLLAFSERGESSDDVGEEADVSLEACERGESAALQALFVYAASSPGLIEEVCVGMAREPEDALDDVPQALRARYAVYLERGA